MTKMELKIHLCFAKTSVESDALSENKALHANIIITQNKQ